jgi:hypothetical protein
VTSKKTASAGSVSQNNEEQPQCQRRKWENYGKKRAISKGVSHFSQLCGVVKPFYRALYGYTKRNDGIVPPKRGRLLVNIALFLAIKA